MPLELKTGRSTFSSEHKGQVTLYSMIMKKEVDYKPKRSEDDALLLYLSDGTLKNVPHGIEEQQGKILQAIISQDLEFICVYFDDYRPRAAEERLGILFDSSIYPFHSDRRA